MLSLRKVSKEQWVKFVIHLIVICMIFFLPEMMMSYASPRHHSHWGMMVYAKSAVFVLFFYLNYYVIINRTLLGNRRSYVSFVLVNLALIVVLLAVVYGLWIYIVPHRGERHHDLPRNVALIRGWSIILRDLGMVVLTIALSAALRYAENWTKLKKHNEQLLAMQREDELQNLKSQLNPHFLFNTLNTIYSLIEVNPREAQDAVHRLSKLLRYVLYESPASVPLSTEVDFARSYIALMNARLGEGVVQAEYGAVADDVQVAPMIFITLIENALKHGNTGRRDQPIHISIATDADGRVVCRTFNHFAPDKARARVDSGIGLANLRRRLQLIYGDRATLTTTIVDDTYEAILTINPE